MIQPWIFSFFHALPEGNGAGSQAISAHFDRHLALWERAERQGFEGIFFSEHHFGPAYSPSPNLLVAAMAARTSTLRLGTLGGSTAYATALRIVEEAAMLDHLTHGRLEIGIVRGVPHELERLGMSIPEGDRRFDETLRAIDAAFRSSPEDFLCGSLPVVPAMAQSNPPKWLAITSERSARRAASLGWKACSGFISVEMLAKLFDAYRDERGAASKADTLNDLGVRRKVLIASDPGSAAEAQEILRSDTIALMRNEITLATGAPSGKAQPIIDLEERLAAMLSSDEFIAGTSAQVADEIISQCRQVGCAHFLAGFDSTDVFDDMAKMHQLFADEVIPILRKADLSAPAKETDILSAPRRTEEEVDSIV